MSAEDMVPFNAMLTREQVEWLKREAAQENRSASGQLRQILVEQMRLKEAA